MRKHIDVDHRFGKVSSPNAGNFMSYLGLIAQCHVFIVIPSRDEVKEIKKNLIW